MVAHSVAAKSMTHPITSLEVPSDVVSAEKGFGGFDGSETGPADVLGRILCVPYLCYHLRNFYGA